VLKELQTRSDQRVFGDTLAKLRPDFVVTPDTGALAGAEQALGDLNTDLLIQNEHWRDINNEAERYRATLIDTRTAGERLADTIGGIGAIADALASSGLLDTTKIVNGEVVSDESARRFVETISSGLDVAANLAAGNFVGVITSGLSFLGGLFGGGPSPTEIALAENTQATRENTARLEDRHGGLGGEANVSAIIGDFFETQIGRQLQTATDLGDFTLDEEANRRAIEQLEALGLTFEELQTIAETYGINIAVDGRLLGEGLHTLTDEVNRSIEAQLRWQDSLEEQEQRLSLRSRIAGEEQTPEREFGFSLDAARQLDSGVIDRFFAGVDLGDPEAVRRASLAFLDAFENGRLSAEELGKLTREDLLALFEDSATFLDSFNEGLQTATRSMQNVPEFFNLAEAEFAVRRDRPSDVFGTDGAQAPTVVAVREGEPSPVELGDEARTRIAIPIIEGLSGGTTLRDLEVILTRLAGVQAAQVEAEAPAITGAPRRDVALEPTGTLELTGMREFLDRAGQPILLADASRRGLADPITEGLGDLGTALGGGATLRDLLDALRTAGVGGSGATVYITGDVVQQFSGAAAVADSAALARSVREGQITLGLASAGDADLA